MKRVHLAAQLHLHIQIHLASFEVIAVVVAPTHYISRHLKALTSILYANYLFTIYLSLFSRLKNKSNP